MDRGIEDQSETKGTSDSSRLSLNSDDKHVSDDRKKRKKRRRSTSETSTPFTSTQSDLGYGSNDSLSGKLTTNMIYERRKRNVDPKTEYEKKKHARPSIRKIPEGYSARMKNWWETIGQGTAPNYGGIAPNYDGQSYLHKTPRTQRHIPEGKHVRAQTLNQRQYRTPTESYLYSQQISDSSANKFSTKDQKKGFRFWRRLNEIGFSFYLSYSFEKRRLATILRLTCITLILIVLMKNYSDHIYSCMCFTPSLLVIVLLAAASLIVTEK